MRKRKNETLQKLIYYVIVVFIMMMGYRVYKIWYENYKLSNPQIIEAMSTNYSEEQPLRNFTLG